MGRGQDALKTQKTPPGEIRLALKRAEEWNEQKDQEGERTGRAMDGGSDLPGGIRGTWGGVRHCRGADLGQCWADAGTDGRASGNVMHGRGASRRRPRQSLAQEVAALRRRDRDEAEDPFRSSLNLGVTLALTLSDWQYISLPKAL